MPHPSPTLTPSLNLSGLERWCLSCFGLVPVSVEHRCLHCGVAIPPMPRSQLHHNSLRLTWHEVTERRGPGRKQRLIGSQFYSSSTQADLWQQAQALTDAGYIVTITPAAPSVVDADAYAPDLDPSSCVLDIAPQ